MGAAFFDLDRTLLDVNSGHLWLRAEWREGHLGWAAVARSVVWFTRYALGDDDLEAAIREAVAVYRGVPAERMDARVRRWFRDEVEDHLRADGRAAIRAHQEAGDTCVLATSGSHFAARCAAEALGLDEVIATELEIDEGLLTGGVAAMAFGRHKLDQCAAWAEARGIHLDDCAFYTDSFSDLPLLERVGQPVVVSPDRRLRREAQRRGWPIADWGPSA